ncbi:GNAT family N-acetyltransferase [Nocardioides piscis]|uniref:GNAT family N-acetyltransferase n=1 Tax=Nocardioides piscis TaxID=2714938 RepID=A0A6G7YE89_9ACTN|nr:GNAT family N-acetyltransferase [Nocardioides piscis]QIK74927.1 GNAT family N-acetyltransferase [Nocardioides piscis]
MSRRTAPLTLDHLAQVDETCRSCLFWSTDPVARAAVRAGEEPQAQEAWLSWVMREWGSCGRVALVEGRVVGHALYAPSPFVPGALGLATSPPSPDAIVLMTVRVDPASRGQGIGRLLVQGMARDLVTRGHPAVEAFGDTRGRAVGCLLPAEFLGRVGFKTQRAHATTPRMRMDLRTTATWKSEVEAALEKLWGAVRPAPSRAPQPRA